MTEKSITVKRSRALPMIQTDANGTEFALFSPINSADCVILDDETDMQQYVLSEQAERADRLRQTIENTAKLAQLEIWAAAKGFKPTEQ